MGDENSFVSGLSDLKNVFDALRSMLGTIKDAKDILPDSEQKQAIELSIEASEKQLLIAEAQIADSLGYELCRCIFPPVIMLKVGYREDQRNDMALVDVYECPKCKQNTAGPWAYSRKMAD
jgi:hypothetical protein